MGRKRCKRDQWMPQRVYVGRSAYELKASGKTIRLCSLEATKAEVWLAYENAINFTASKDFSSLISEYLKSHRFRDLAPSTQKSYLRYAKPDGKIIKTFGKMNPNAISTPHIRQFMDLIGETAPVQANRYLGFLGGFFIWAKERGQINSTPHLGIRRFSEKPREKYVEDDEYLIAYNRAKLFVKIAIEISYCCGARISDVLKIKRSDLKADGIFIKQGKTGRKQIKKWTPRLKKAVSMAIDLPRYKKYQNTNSMHLIHNMSCQRYTYDGFSKEWQKAKKGLDFTFHDLKAKSISDYEGDKAKFSGNKKSVHVYDRKTEVVDTHDFPEKPSE